VGLGATFQTLIGTFSIGHERTLNPATGLHSRVFRDHRKGVEKIYQVNTGDSELQFVPEGDDADSHSESQSVIDVSDAQGGTLGSPSHGEQPGKQPATTQAVRYHGELFPITGRLTNSAQAIATENPLGLRRRATYRNRHDDSRPSADSTPYLVVVDSQERTPIAFDDDSGGELSTVSNNRCRRHLCH